MPLIPSFTVTEYNLTPQTITITDTSTGSDINITDRRIYFTNAEGDYIVPTGTTTDYVDFPIIFAAINVDIISVSMALNIRIDWVDVNGDVIVSTDTNFPFTYYLEWFLYQLGQMQISTPNIVQDRNYYSNKMQLRCEIDAANNAIAFGDDIFSAQQCIDRAQLLVDNQNVYF